MHEWKLWVQRLPDRDLWYHFVREGCFTPLISQILINKGFDNINSAYQFLHPQLSDLGNPFEIPEMDLAVKRIEDALKNNEKIGIYGDSDADGIIGSYILYDFLHKISQKEPFVLLPDKNREGYGFHSKFLPIFKEAGVKLIITVDVGISAYETVNEAKALGIDVIVTDHHEVRERPQTWVITNKFTPKDSSLHHICGAGVVLALIRALRTYLYQRGFFTTGKPPSLREYLELVAIATLADMVPLLGDNRVITYFGFRDLANPAHPALRTLFSSLNLKYPLTEEDLYYKIISSINACGRLGKPEVCFNLLKSTTPQEIEANIAEMLSLNQKRQNLEIELWDKIQNNLIIEESSSVVLGIFEGIPKGMLGLLANRLKNQYEKPVFLLSIENGIAYGSARSPEGINLLEKLWSFKDNFIELGGHQRAFGFSLYKEKITEFKNIIKQLGIEYEKREKFLFIDGQTNLTELLLEENQLAIKEMPPFGLSHTPPLLVIKNFEIKDFEILKEKHTKLSLREGSQEITAICFNQVLPSKVKLLAAVPYFNNYSMKLELKVEDFKA
ncbi:MAG: single-stranded-DNA-specific exonuclease RecJ [Caldimicrobium sp.]|nr:single-stranded-DNA-specific exonuclease RecJ [Caldimicrobium sp.]MCX7873988.1 single-stranded-DNA-specific exonuclease RecJ [Caldimicrobium sp.]MDW8094136.1 single-stranded-DNA-specific exonuclease RecJ [Caldimicrobium sp.]